MWYVIYAQSVEPRCYKIYTNYSVVVTKTDHVEIKNIILCNIYILRSPNIVLLKDFVRLLASFPRTTKNYLLFFMARATKYNFLHKFRTIKL